MCSTIKINVVFFLFSLSLFSCSCRQYGKRQDLLNAAFVIYFVECIYLDSITMPGNIILWLTKEQASYILCCALRHHRMKHWKMYTKWKTKHNIYIITRKQPVNMLWSTILTTQCKKVNSFSRCHRCILTHLTTSLYTDACHDPRWICQWPRFNSHNYIEYFSCMHIYLRSI